jgi:hypothetical protein
MIGTLPRLLAGLAAVLAAAPLTPLLAGGPALAAPTPTTPSLTWAVQPADRQGPDGRRWMEHTLNPGQVVTEHLAVRNFSGRTAVFALKAADGYLTDKGRFNMLPSNKASVDGGTWIKVQDRVTVAAKGTTVVPFTITVPRDAKPGDHPAGIAATVTATGGTVAVESRVGFRVMIRITGTITAALTVGDLTTIYRHSWNPFKAGTIHVRYTTTNNGSVTATGTGQVTTTELLGTTKHSAKAEVGQTLPGGTHDIDIQIGGVWALGPLKTTVDLTPALLDGDTSDADIRPTSATTTVWTLPWPQLILTALLTALALTARTARRRRRRRLADLLARARDEGREEGLSSARPENAATRP